VYRSEYKCISVMNYFRCFKYTFLDYINKLKNLFVLCIQHTKRIQGYFWFLFVCVYKLKFVH